MNRLAVISAVLAVILTTACGPDNPFGPDNPSYSALTGILKDSTTARLAWTGCPDSDFASYTLYRSAGSGIQSDPSSATAILVAEDRSTISYEDTDLQSGSIWFYALKVMNEGGGASWSNEVSVNISVILDR